MICWLNVLRNVTGYKKKRRRPRKEQLTVKRTRKYTTHNGLYYFAMLESSILRTHHWQLLSTLFVLSSCVPLTLYILPRYGAVTQW